MASKARKLQKEKEKYMEFRNRYKKLQNEAVWVIVAASVACALLVGAGLYSGDSSAYGYVIMFAIPFIGAIYYAVRCAKKVKKFDMLVAGKEQEMAAGDEGIKNKEG